METCKRKRWLKFGSLMMMLCGIFLLVGCSKKESSESEKIQNFEFGDTATYKTDGDKNVAEVTFDDPHEIREKDAKEDGFKEDYNKYVMLVCTIKCKEGEIDPHELSGGEITVADSKGNVADGITLVKNRMPNRINEGNNLRVNYIYGLDNKKEKTITISLKNFQWKGKIKDNPVSDEMQKTLDFFSDYKKDDDK